MARRFGRVVAVGMDGATFDLLIPWVREGKLPFFKRMMEEGVYGSLDPAPNMRSAASWASYYTGKNPGKHGIYEFYEFVPENYSIKFINGSHCFEPSLWRLLSNQGLISIVINVPMTYPVEPINGVILAGLDAPGTGSRGFCYPPDSLKELEDQVGTYVLEPGLTGFIIDDNLDMAVERLFEDIEQKHKVMFYLMKNKNWDFFTIVYRSLDAAQHCFWKFMDPHHPNCNPHLRDKYGNIILKVYQKLDAILGEIRDYLRPDDVLLVMSDHGFGPKHPANNQLNAWLAGKGYLTYRHEPSSRSIRSVSRRGLRDCYQFLAGRLPRRYKEAFARFFPRIRNRVHSQLCYAGIDWRKTRAYSDTLFSNIRINLQEREGLGIVQQGEDYKTIVENIRGDLLDCRDAKSGKRIVESIFHKDLIYSGPHRDKAPDLTIRWREDIFISGIELDPSFDVDSLPTIRPFIPAEDARVISGDHRRFGILLATGPGLKKGCRIEGVNIMDLAPTVLYILELPVPEDMDGKVLGSIFQEEVLLQKPCIRKQTAEAQEQRKAISEYEEDENVAISQRLRDLGYLE
jgi:predicted AlkP superfamily phosphohydrolase/phosphomutase